jgi:hypothetical protein
MQKLTVTPQENRGMHVQGQTAEPELTLNTPIQAPTLLVVNGQMSTPSIWRTTQLDMQDAWFLAFPFLEN